MRFPLREKIIFATLTLTVLAAIPFLANGQTIAELKLQIENLLKQIEVLQANVLALPVAAPSLATSSPTTTARQCPALTKNLYPGATDMTTSGEVSLLQKFLQAEGIFTFPTITGYFGGVTEGAVQAWQAKNKVANTGSAATTGYGAVGPKTRAAIATKCDPQLSSPTTLKPVPVTVPPIEIEIEPSATSSPTLPAPSATLTPSLAARQFVCGAERIAPRNFEKFIGIGAKNITYLLGPGGHGIGDPIYPAVAKYLADAGISWTLKQVPLRSVEPEEGQFNWKNHDTLFTTWSAAGIKIVGTFGFEENPVEWAVDPDNPLFPRIAAWDSYVRAVVGRYGAPGMNIIHDWETWGEAHPRKYDVDTLIPVHNAAYAAVKAVDPTARVWGPAILFTSSSGDTAMKFLETFVQQADFDVLSIHTYMDTPAAHYAKVKEVRALLDANNKKSVPISITEFNTASTNDRCDASDDAQKRQEIFLAQTYACLANAGVEQAFWFTVTDWYAGPGVCANGIHRVGILTTEPTQKRAYAALKELSAYLRTFSK